MAEGILSQWVKHEGDQVRKGDVLAVIETDKGRLPLARKLAREHGIDLATVSGTGPGGRIVRADIEDAIRPRGATQPQSRPAALAPSGPAEPVPGRPAAPAQPRLVAPAPMAAAPSAAADAEEIPLHRRTARRQRPRLYLTVVANVKITVTDLLTRACAAALAAHPEVNVSWDTTRILRHRHVSIGIAVAINDGLIVPAIRGADRKALTEIAREAHDLTARARARKLSPDELSGGTFTISNLGMYGIRQFTAVSCPPQAAILAVGEASASQLCAVTR